MPSNHTVSYGRVAVGTWFCDDLIRHDWRSFRLDRMDGRTSTTRRFRPRELPADEAAEFVRQGVERWACARSSTVRLCLSATAARWPRSSPGDRSGHRVDDRRRARGPHLAPRPDDRHRRRRACHLTGLGQGSAMALEDAVLLPRLLRAHDPETAFAQFTELRRPHVERIVKWAPARATAMPMARSVDSSATRPSHSPEGGRSGKHHLAARPPHRLACRRTRDRDLRRWILLLDRYLKGSASRSGWTSRHRRTVDTGIRCTVPTRTREPRRIARGSAISLQGSRTFGPRGGQTTPRSSTLIPRR